MERSLVHSQVSTSRARTASGGAAAAASGVSRVVSAWTPLGAAVQALQHAMQTGFPPAKLLLILTAYALVFGSLAVRYFRWE